jgi:hypothetical protein
MKRKSKGVNKMSDHKRITIVLPTTKGWDIEDLDKKAEAMGMSRNEFIINAIDMMINFNTNFLQYVKKTAEGHKVPEYLVLQNIVHRKLIKERAEDAVFGPRGRLRDEFIHVSDSKGDRVLEGEELEKYTFERDVRELKGSKEYERYLNRIQTKIDIPE